MSRWVLAGLTLWAAIGLVACGGDGEAPKTGPKAAAVDPRPTPPPDSVPPGVDPETLRTYEEAPVPPPVPFATSKVRAAAAAAGAFDGLPPAGNLGALLSAFAGVKTAAAVSAGRTVGGPAGPTVEPSREELRFAELTERLRAALAAAPPEEARAAWKATGLGADALEGFTLVTTTAKVFGTGYVETVETALVPISAPK